MEELGDGVFTLAFPNLRLYELDFFSMMFGKEAVNKLIVGVGCTKFLLQDLTTHPSHWQFTSIYIQVLFPLANFN